MKPTKWGWVVWYPENLELGKYTDIGWGTVILAHAGVIIKDKVQIGPLCAIISRSTIDGKEGRIILEKKATIGSHSTIMPGVRIGISATVAAHSFINKNVPDGETWAGIPAKPL